jgi:hypothetical protein
MKQLFLLIALIITISTFAFGQTPDASASANRIPNGWGKSGDNPTAYDFFADKNTKYKGTASGTIKAKPTAVKDKFGSFIQVVRADNYRGKRIRLSGYLKTENVEEFASFWLRVDGSDLSLLDFDNMEERPTIKGTNDWTKHELIVDVPQNAGVIVIGTMFGGSTGQVWIDELKLEIVDNNVAKTSMKLTAEAVAEGAKYLEDLKRNQKEVYEKQIATMKTRPQKPINLDFEDSSQSAPNKSNQKQTTAPTGKP